MKRLMQMSAGVAGSLSLMMACGVAHATTIDFSGVSNGTVVTNQYSGVVFSLAGGPDSSGAPMTWNWSGEAVANSNNFDYPTANILNVAFSAPVSGLSFTFDNYGVGAPTTYTAYDASNTVVDSGSLQFDNSFGTVINVAGSGIADLQFNNNVGNTNWYYGVQEITYTAGVPEPATWAMLVVGLGLAGTALRQARRSGAQAAA